MLGTEQLESAGFGQLVMLSGGELLLMEGVGKDGGIIVFTPGPIPQDITNRRDCISSVSSFGARKLFNTGGSIPSTRHVPFT